MSKKGSAMPMWSADHQGLHWLHIQEQPCSRFSGVVNVMHKLQSSIQQ